jgi:hypothetical protein
MLATGHYIESESESSQALSADDAAHQAANDVSKLGCLGGVKVGLCRAAQYTPGQCLAELAFSRHTTSRDSLAD